ncbi:glutaredoxin-1-like [Eurytemora carolleeae]|uniref:glutaredoxin-1-like n=1 Tax=Eurytemora carolleeae TaxID=1294199 RepID=UPI000C7885D9|nr:glutaredoxin-1-like [Eurytemora carolleeae]|eukprot:XP_023334290.1 glutaredoxin-1-like [Eurytemora affinis]
MSSLIKMFNRILQAFSNRDNPGTMSDTKEMIDNLLQEKKVVVISKSYCPYCTKAKAALSKYAINPEDIEILEIENRPEMDEIQRYMKKLTGQSSVPRVFIGGKCIGGGDDVMALHQSKQLETMLKNVAALN